MTMVKIYDKGEFKNHYRGKHLHFCKRCWARFVCGIACRKDCKLDDGFYCLDCGDKSKQLKARKTGA